MAKVGRKPIDIDEDKLKALMRLRPSIEDTAAFFECSHDTIERYVNNNFGVSFASFRDQNMVHTRIMLIRTALEKAKKGDNIMLIFCLKNLCGWRDKPADDTSDDPFIKLVASMNTKDLVSFAKQKLGELESA